MSGALDLFGNAPLPSDEIGPVLEEGDDEFVIPDFSKFVAGYEFDFNNVPVRPAPILQLNGHTISTPGNITNIQAQAKAGKTSVIGGIVASVIVGERDGCDTLGFTSKNPQCGIVLVFDTEQSRFDHDTNIRLILKRAKYEGKPQWLRSFCLTERSTSERFQFIFAAMKWAAEEQGGLFMVVIDGVADLCSDPNNAEDAFHLVQELHKAAIEYNCGIITVLHENPGSDYGKMRGHLGSQLERKAETALRLAKDASSGLVTIWAERARHCMIPKTEGQCIQFDTEKHCFVSCGSAKEMKHQEQMDTARKEISEAFEGAFNLGYTELCDKIVKVTGLKIDSAKKRVKKWSDAGLINNLGGSYVIASTPQGASGVKV